MIRRLIIAVVITYVSALIIAPVVVVFGAALREGPRVYAWAVTNEHTVAAIRLTILVTVITVLSNLTFGLAAAWAIAKFEFAGKRLLLAAIDLPFAVSPVIAGMIFALLFGSQGALGPLMAKHDIKVIFALPGIVLATLFVTFPFVARELIPILQSQGTEEEEAATMLGASGWQTFWKVTLPNAKWGLLYGVILSTARAAGEFGAVSVVSGHIRGVTTTIPLHVEMLYNEYQFTAAFAVASILTLIGGITLIAKRVVQHRSVQSAHSL
jgi:sulfate/thiosulfate transport system permease protein